MRLGFATLAVLALAPMAHAQDGARQNQCLAEFVSRYMRETAPNLSRTFYVATQSDVALSFDEADALFGRSEEANTDRFANQNAATLIARIQQRGAIVPLASNGRRALIAGFDSRSRNTGAVVIEAEGGARIVEFTRANRRAALDYANASIEACPAIAR